MSVSQKKIVIRLFYVLLLASLFSAGWINNSIAHAPQSSFYTGESINAAEPGLTVVPTLPMQTTEAGGTASFTVALSSQPTANVTVNLSSSDITEGTITFPLTPTLSFTKGNWDSPKLVTATGVDDFVVDGNIAYNIVLDPASVGDSLYESLPDVNVGVTNIDRLTIVTTSPFYTTEGDGTAKFTIALFRQPSASVTVALSSNDESEGIISSPVTDLTFTTGNWDTPQTVEVKGVDDCSNDGDIPYKVTFTSTSLDPIFIKTESLDLVNYDAPTIGWVKPVGTDEIYFSDGFSPINLEVINLCPAEPIQKVKFTRWVAASEYHLIIREVDDPPHVAEIKPQDLESGWTQVFAQAYGLPNEIQTFSKSERMLILKDFNFWVHLPLVNK